MTPWYYAHWRLLSQREKAQPDLRLSGTAKSSEACLPVRRLCNRSTMQIYSFTGKPCVKGFEGFSGHVATTSERLSILHLPATAERRHPCPCARFAPTIPQGITPDVLKVFPAKTRGPEWSRTTAPPIFSRMLVPPELQILDLSSVHRVPPSTTR